MADTTKITNVIKTTTAQLRNMLPKIEILLKVILKSRAEAVGVKVWSRIGVGEKTFDFITLPPCANDEKFIKVVIQAMTLDN